MIRRTASVNSRQSILVNYKVVPDMKTLAKICLPPDCKVINFKHKLIGTKNCDTLKRIHIFDSVDNKKLSNDIKIRSDSIYLVYFVHKLTIQKFGSNSEKISIISQKATPYTVIQSLKKKNKKKILLYVNGELDSSRMKELSINDKIFYCFEDDSLMFTIFYPDKKKDYKFKLINKIEEIRKDIDPNDQYIITAKDIEIHNLLTMGEIYAQYGEELKCIRCQHFSDDMLSYIFIPLRSKLHYKFSFKPNTTVSDVIEKLKSRFVYKKNNDTIDFVLRTKNNDTNRQVLPMDSTLQQAVTPDQFIRVSPERNDVSFHLQYMLVFEDTNKTKNALISEGSTVANLMESLPNMIIKFKNILLNDQPDLLITDLNIQFDEYLKIVRKSDPNEIIISSLNDRSMSITRKSQIGTKSSIGSQDIGAMPSSGVKPKTRRRNRNNLSTSNDDPSLSSSLVLHQSIHKIECHLISISIPEETFNICTTGDIKHGRELMKFVLEAKPELSSYHFAIQDSIEESIISSNSNIEKYLDGKINVVEICRYKFECRILSTSIEKDLPVNETIYKLKTWMSINDINVKNNFGFYVGTKMLMDETELRNNMIIAVRAINLQLNFKRTDTQRVKLLNLKFNNEFDFVLKNLSYEFRLPIECLQIVYNGRIFQPNNKIHESGVANGDTFDVNIIAVPFTFKIGEQRQFELSFVPTSSVDNVLDTIAEKKGFKRQDLVISSLKPGMTILKLNKERGPVIQIIQHDLSSKFRTYNFMNTKSDQTFKMPFSEETTIEEVRREIAEKIFNDDVLEESISLMFAGKALMNQRKLKDLFIPKNGIISVYVEEDDEEQFLTSIYPSNMFTGTITHNSITKLTPTKPAPKDNANDYMRRIQNKDLDEVNPTKAPKVKPPANAARETSIRRKSMSGSSFDEEDDFGSVSRFTKTYHYNDRTKSNVSQAKGTHKVTNKTNRAKNRYSGDSSDDYDSKFTKTTYIRDKTYFKSSLEDDDSEPFYMKTMRDGKESRPPQAQRSKRPSNKRGSALSQSQAKKNTNIDQY